MATTPSPFADPAVPILQNAAGIDDTQRADLHDIFHGSKDPDELARQLQPLAVPDDVKNDLFDAKKKFMPVGGVSGATSVINSMKNLDPQALEIAEAHPNVLKTLVSAATAPAKEASKPAGEGKSKDGGKPPAATDASAAAAPALQPDIPATPSGHALVQTSDYALHHIPVQNIGAVKKRDPLAQILHVQE